MTSKYGPLGIRVDDCYRNVAEARIVEMVVLLGWPYETESPSATLASQQIVQTWTQIGLGFRPGRNGERFFDPVEVLNFMKRSGLDGRDGFLADRYIPQHQRLVADLTEVGPAGFVTDEERQFIVDYSRTFNLRSVAAGSKLRLRAPVPLTGDYVRDLDVTPFMQTTAKAKIHVSSGRLEVQMLSANDAEVTLGARWSFKSRLQEPRQGPVHTETALYLSDREGLIVISDRIRALANSLAGTGAPALDTVRAFWEYINNEMISGALHYDQIDFSSPCDWVLDSGWFDCQLAAALFVALCRARGIPGRVIGGYQLYQMHPARHYWAELWLKDRGWVPFDFISWDVSLGGRDREWCDRFFGRLDYRVAFERMPREFTGALGVPIPPAWYILQVPIQGGMEIGLLESGGTTVYADHIRVTSGSKA